MILGAVLAGGMSSRFGTDKALAEFEGHTLIALAVDALSGWCEKVVVVGRETAPAPTLPDWPRPGMGPLGGLAAALHAARDEDYETVLTCGVDAVLLPDDLPRLLGPAPACLAQQPVIGLWPSAAAATLEALLHSEERHSMKRFAALVGARLVEIPVELANVNTPEDLAALQARLPVRPPVHYLREPG
ncbi:MAG: NTP transferase domain-containing protein [Novosphingobium sp.]|nr:NTP transferase domain-containing protein [Novosphingobium sp.]